MSAKYFAILTNLGAAKMANATALGTKLNLTHMAVGDGGGTLQTPNPAQTALRGERRRAALNMLSVDPNNTSAIIAEQVIPESEGGWWVREIGLYDSDGVLIAVANCPETYKPLLQEGSGRTQTIRMVLTVSSTEAVTLKIDPAVVLATRQYVDDKVIEVHSYIDSQLEAHTRSRNHPDATTAAKGFVQLSSDDNSAVEDKAATPAAVKKVRALAETKAPIESPVFTGTPTTPTPAVAASGLEIANAEFVAEKIAALVGSAPGVLDTLQEISAALNNNPDFANEMIRKLAGKFDKTGGVVDGEITSTGIVRAKSSSTIELNPNESRPRLTSRVGKDGEWYSSYLQQKTGTIAHLDDIPAATNIVQGTGQSTTNVISQKGVTDAISAHGIGYGQQYMNMMGSRQPGSWYPNNTGRPIFIMVFVGRDSSGGTEQSSANINLQVGSEVISIPMIRGANSGGAQRGAGSALIPDGAIYTVTTEFGSEVKTWWELR
ncbi:phage tail protein [Edwardsiella tarda]|uniref:phage tail protein n=1 Tax=Edwardsiella tarda TaxID=636 RepID=UPI00098F30CF|nr:phage tail protein [Edwardsiella tarda]